MRYLVVCQTLCYGATVPAANINDDRSAVHTVLRDRRGRRRTIFRYLASDRHEWRVPPAVAPAQFSRILATAGRIVGHRRHAAGFPTVWFPACLCRNDPCRRNDLELGIFAGGHEVAISDSRPYRFRQSVKLGLISGIDKIRIISQRRRNERSRLRNKLVSADLHRLWTIDLKIIPVRRRHEPAQFTILRWAMIGKIQPRTEHPDQPIPCCIQRRI